MASRRGSKKARKKKEKSRPAPPQQPPPPTMLVPTAEDRDSSPRQSFWENFHRARKGIYACFLLVVAIIGFDQGWPSLSLQKDESLDPQNPYQSMFLINSEGYIPATNIVVTCQSAFVTNQGNAFKDNETISKLEGPLLHGDQRTLPCIYRTIGAANDPTPIPGIKGFNPSRGRITDAAMVVKIEYSICWINLPFARRKQTFQLVAVPANDGTLHWTFH